MGTLATDFLDFENEINSLSNPLKDGFLSPKQITWHRALGHLDPNGEDPVSNYQTIVLRCLPNYNDMRSWPSTLGTETGEIDKQSVQIFLNKEYLTTRGYINSAGYFDYGPDVDFFIMDGLRYKAEGDTAASASLTDDLFITIVLKRDITNTGNRR